MWLLRANGCHPCGRRKSTGLPLSCCFSVSLQDYISLSFFFVLRFAIERATGPFFTFVAQFGVALGGDNLCI